MISLQDYMMGRDEDYPPTPEMIENATNLLEQLSLLEEELHVIFILNSGYRPEAMIEKGLLPGCPHDAHSTCQGIDLHDPDLAISGMLVWNQAFLEKVGLYMESPQSAKTHLHLQSVPPKSGKRIFIA